MVDALRRARELVRPHGRVVDVHPTAERATVIIGTRDAGPVDAGDAPARHQAASDAVDAVVGQGLFVVERLLEFSFHVYADTLDELQEHIVEDWNDARIGADTMAQAERWLRETPEARVSVREMVRLTLLRPARTA